MNAEMISREIDSIGDIQVLKVNRKCLVNKLSELGFEDFENTSDSELLQEYVTWTREEGEKLPDGTVWAKCGECNAICNPDWDFCPVCACGYDEEALSSPPAELSTVDLDASVDRIKVLLTNAARSYYDLGRELLEVFRNKLYKTRTNEQGLPIYKSWDQFSTKELGISGSRSRTIFTCAEQFTRENFATLGIEKLRVLARLPEGETRKAFVDQAKELSTRELANKVAEAPAFPTNDEVEGSLAEKVREKTKAKEAGLKLGTEAAKQARERKAGTKPEKAVRVENDVAVEDGITAVFQIGTFDVPLEPTGKGRNYSGSNVLVNGVVCHYEIRLGGENKYMRIKIENPTNPDFSD